MAVTLVEVTSQNVRAVCDLALAGGQERFVAPNVWSLAQAYAEYDTAWPRAITSDGALVGFLMLQVDPADSSGRPYWLWRLMVDRHHQGRGYGRAALLLAVDELRSRGAQEMYTSWVPGEGSPEAFYLGLGFAPTGDVDEGEIVARLRLQD